MVQLQCSSMRHEPPSKSKVRVEQGENMNRKKANMLVAQVIANNLMGILAKYRSEWDKDNKETRCEACGSKVANPFTQEWLAAEVGMTKSSLIHFLHANRMISLVDLTRICQRLNVTMEYMTRGLVEIDFEE